MQTEPPVDPEPNGTPFPDTDTEGAPEVAPETQDPETEGAPEEAEPDPNAPDPPPGPDPMVIDPSAHSDAMLAAATVVPEGYEPPVMVTGPGILVEGDRLVLADLVERVNALEAAQPPRLEAVS